MQSPTGGTAREPPPGGRPGAMPGPTVTVRRREGGLAPLCRGRAPLDAETGMDAERLMGEAISLAAPTRPHPNPRVGAVVLDASGEVAGRGAHAGPGQPARRGRGPGRGGRAGGGRHPGGDPGALRPHRPHPAVHRGDPGGGGGAGAGGGRRPRLSRGRAGPGPAAGRRPGGALRHRRRRRRGPGPGVLPPPPHRAAPGDPEGRPHPRRPGGRRRRHLAVDHLARSPGRRPPPAGRGRRRRWWGPGPWPPTTPC